MTSESKKRWGYGQNWLFYMSKVFGSVVEEQKEKPIIISTWAMESFNP